MFDWKDEYLTGIETIDEQHKKLFEIAGRTYELLKNEFYIDKYDRIVELLEELKSYTVFHFQFEEEYMLSIGYKRYFSQKAAHNEFIEKVNGMDLNKIDENQDAYIMDILRFVTNWIAEHIIRNDKLIGQA